MLQKQVEAGHWVSLTGACVMTVAFSFALGGFFMPWWTEDVVVDGDGIYTEVNLWYTISTITMQAEEVKHMGCDSACDRTRVVQEKVGVRQQSWEDVCRIAEGDLAASCAKIWAIRGGVGLALFLGFFHMLASCLAFSGAGKHGDLRFPPILGLVLAFSCMILLLLSPSLAFSVDGRVPRAGDSEKAALTRRQDLGGTGFYLSVVGGLLSIAAALLALLAHTVWTSRDEFNEPDVELQPTLQPRKYLASLEAVSRDKIHAWHDG